MKKNILSLLQGKKTIGLYVGHNTIDVAVVKGTLSGPKLIKFGQTSILPEEGSSENIATEKSENAFGVASSQQPEIKKKSRDDYMVEAIQRLFRENDIKPVNVVSAIPSEDVMVRYFQMPKIPRQEWETAINFEAKRYIPFRLEDVASDFYVTPAKPPLTGMDVILAAVKQKTTERFVGLFDRAGIKVFAIEPSPFSLLRALNEAGQIDREINMAVINLEAKGANINILRHGMPYIIRDIPLENTSGEESLEPIFEKLLLEMKLSFDFYEKQFPSEIIEKMIIYSSLPLGNWHEIVAKELQLTVEIGDPFRGIKIKEDVVPSGLAICFGLALRGVTKPYIDLNLYKEQFLIHKRKETFLKVLFSEASVAVLLLIIIKLLCMKGIAPLTNELSKTLSERPKKGVSVKSDKKIEELERVKNKMYSEKVLMENIISNRTNFTSRLEDLAKFVPDNIWLTELNFEELLDRKDASKAHRKLSIKGYCLIDKNLNETDVINNFLIKLKEDNNINKGMKKVDIVSVERKEEMEKGRVASFEILFTGP